MKDNGWYSSDCGWITPKADRRLKDGSDSRLPFVSHCGADGWKVKDDGWNSSDNGWNVKDDGWYSSDNGWITPKADRRLKDGSDSRLPFVSHCGAGGWKVKDDGWNL